MDNIDKKVVFEEIKKLIDESSRYKEKLEAVKKVVDEIENRGYFHKIADPSAWQDDDYADYPFLQKALNEIKRTLEE